MYRPNSTRLPSMYLLRYLAMHQTLVLSRDLMTSLTSRVRVHVRHFHIMALPAYAHPLAPRTDALPAKPNYCIKDWWGFFFVIEILSRWILWYLLCKVSKRPERLSLCDNDPPVSLLSAVRNIKAVMNPPPLLIYEHSKKGNFLLGMFLGSYFNNRIHVYRRYKKQKSRF